MKRAQNPMRRSWLDESEGGWIAHRLRLLLSPAWRLRPVPLCRLLDRIEIEHMRHAGRENGHLIVSFDQFVAAGVSRKIIRATIDLGASLGLLAIVQSAEMVRSIRAPNRYRLTYVPEKDRRAPTDEWASVTEGEVQKAVAAFQDIATAKRKSSPQFPFLPSTSSPSGHKRGSTSSPFGQTPVTHGEHTLISGGNADEVEGVVQAPPHMGRASRDAPAEDAVHISDALRQSLVLAASGGRR